MKRNSAKKFDCNRGVYILFRKILVQVKDVTLSKVKEMKTDITKQIKMTSP